MIATSSSKLIKDLNPCIAETQQNISRIITRKKKTHTKAYLLKILKTRIKEKICPTRKKAYNLQKSDAGD